MLERIIENWIEKINERSFEKPFCYMLSSQGYTRVHLTRHNAMEMGKDIIAIAPDGVPCAFQLKTANKGRIGLNQWTKELKPQVDQLITNSIVHPSIKTSIHHRSYLVANGDLEEEVSRSITDMNTAYKRQGFKKYQLQTILKGQLLKWARELETNLWPVELNDITTLLEIYLKDGKEILPKAKLCHLLEIIFLNHDDRPSKAECSRIIASAAVINSLAISNFSNHKNHIAEIEAWMIFIAYLFAFVEKWSLAREQWDNEFQIARDSIYTSIEELIIEVQNKTEIVEGDKLSEPFYFYRIRITWLISFFSIYAIWKMDKKSEENELDEFIRQFCLNKRSQLLVWGEACIPQFLAFYWYFRKINATSEPDTLIANLIDHISKANKPIRIKSEKNTREEFTTLANPYFGIEEVIQRVLDLSDEPPNDYFYGSSYYLASLLHILVRRNYKRFLQVQWSNISRIGLKFFKPDRKWQFYQWYNSKGIEFIEFQKPNQKWDDLKK